MHTRPIDRQPPSRPQRHSLREQAPLLLVDALAQRLRIVLLVHGDCRLQDDGAAVDRTGGEQVHRAPGDFDAGGERVLDSVHAAAERRQQRWVDVEDGAGEGVEHVIAEHAVVAGADDEVHPCGVESLEDGAIARTCVACVFLDR